MNTTAPRTQAMAETHRPGRIAGLDLARGIAILGTLATNIWIFSHPGGMLGYLGSPLSDGAPDWQRQVEHVLQQLANGKFLGLLTLMFGMGLAIQAASARRRERRWPGPYLWRALLLLLDGALHYLLVVEFDVLMGYAVTGAIVAYVIASSERAQRLWIGICAAIHLVLVTLMTWALWSLPAGSLASTPDPNPYQDGTWADLVALRIDNGLLFRFEPIFMAFMGIALFTLGNRLFVGGLFDERGAALRRRLMVVGAVALVADLALGLSSPNWLFLTRYAIAPFVALGMLAAIAGWFLDREPGWVARRLSTVGRVALSAYVLQNIVASALFYGWGLGLNSVSPALRLPVTVLAWAGISASIVALAALWLRRFSRGPLEWLWATGYHRLASLTARPD